MVNSKPLALIGIILLVAGLTWWGLNRPQKATLTSLPTLTTNQGQIIDIPIMIDTKDQTVNAAEVYLTFDPQQLEIIDASKDGTFLQLWVDGQPSFSNAEGTITFAGGLPTPGFQGRGQIGTIKARSKSKGLIRLGFDEKTQVLLNDGQGTAIPLQTEPVSVKVN